MYIPAQPAVAPAPIGIASSVLLAAPIARSAGTILSVARTTLNVLSGDPATVTGTLRPGLAGRMVVLQALGRRGWRAVARTRTGAKGRFQVRYIARGTGSERVRVQFAGDTYHFGAHRRLGRLSVYRLAAAASSKAMCVAERESSMQWHVVDPPYSGGFQFSDETWLAAGGGRFSSTAAGATPRQQVQVFSEYEPSHPGAWPNTVPACGG